MRQPGRNILQRSDARSVHLARPVIILHVDVIASGPERSAHQPVLDRPSGIAKGQRLELPLGRIKVVPSSVCLEYMRVTIDITHSVLP